MCVKGVAIMQHLFFVTLVGGVPRDFLKCKISALAQERLKNTALNKQLQLKSSTLSMFGIQIKLSP